jgi:hypothetical protein
VLRLGPAAVLLATVGEGHVFSQVAPRARTAIPDSRRRLSGRGCDGSGDHQEALEEIATFL